MEADEIKSFVSTVISKQFEVINSRLDIMEDRLKDLQQLKIQLQENTLQTRQFINQLLFYEAKLGTVQKLVQELRGTQQKNLEQQNVYYEGPQFVKQTDEENQIFAFLETQAYQQNISQNFQNQKSNFMTSNQQSDQHSKAQKQSDHKKIVYKTITGQKYHNYNCEWLQKSKIQISAEQAIKEGLKACLVCKP